MHKQAKMQEAFTKIICEETPVLMKPRFGLHQKFTIGVLEVTKE
jgi:hypothetical protein